VQHLHGITIILMFRCIYSKNRRRDRYLKGMLKQRYWVLQKLSILDIDWRNSLTEYYIRIFCIETLVIRFWITTIVSAIRSYKRLITSCNIRLNIINSSISWIINRIQCFAIKLPRKILRNKILIQWKTGTVCGRSWLYSSSICWNILWSNILCWIKCLSESR